MPTAIKKSPAVFSTLLIMLLSLIFSTNEMKAQTVPADVTTVCNIFDKALKLIKQGDEKNILAGIDEINKLRNYRSSTISINDVSRDRLTNAMFTLTQYFEPSLDNQYKAELRQEMNECRTLGEVVAPFYDSFAESFENPMAE